MRKGDKVDMNMKIVGIIATAAAFGIGVLIPNVSVAKVDNYEEALAIVEGKENKLKEIEKADTGAQTTEGTGGESAVAESTVEETNNSADKEKKETSMQANPNADIVFDWSFDDISVNGMKLIEADYDELLKSFGVDKKTMEISDSGFKIDDDPIEWNGKKASCYACYTADDKSSPPLFWDGEKYVTDSLDEKEADRISMSIAGSWEDKDNYADYYNFYYATEFKNNSITDHFDVGNYEHGLSNEEISELSKYINAPFIGGTYEEMNKVMHTDEMLEKGLKDESVSKDDYARYIVDTSFGKCTFTINTYENDKGKNTHYSYSFYDDTYRISMGFRENVENTITFSYSYKHQ
jgi:hypothetical protein